MTTPPPRTPRETSAPTVSQPLDSPWYTDVPGIGKARAAALQSAGILTPLDCLLRLPRCLAAAPDEHRDGPLPRGVPVQVRARVLRCQRRYARGRGRRGIIIEARCERPDGSPLTCRFFNAAWLADKLVTGEWFLFEGRSDQRQNNTLNQPRFHHLPAGDHDSTSARSGCDVSYHIPDGLNERLWRQLVEIALATPDLADPLALIPPEQWQTLLRHGHRPETADEHEQARRAIAERELTAFAWFMHQRRAAMTATETTGWRWDDRIHQRALARLPFQLTDGQHTAVAEIRADMQAPHPMYRLLQGDVGSGKTAIALISALAVIADGGQATILVLTAILAAQHHALCTRCLADSKVQVSLLTGSTSPQSRERILANLADGMCHLIIGTHALIEDPVRFARLGLVVIDEQHKFGVDQCARLIAKGHAPDCLFLTATPILVPWR